MRKLALVLALIFCVSILHAQTGKPLLLREPTLSEKQIAFVYGDDIWTVGREGGEAVRLTSGIGAKSNPRFSPNGSLIAFSAKYEGRTNVYVVAATGGNPRRVTFHSGPDVVAGWTNDGKSILFPPSARASIIRSRGSTPFPSKADSPRLCRSRALLKVRTRRTARTWPTAPFHFLGVRGRTTAEELPRRYGLRTSRIRALSVCRAKIRSIRTQFGSAIQFTFYPTAAARKRSSRTT